MAFKDSVGSLDRIAAALEGIAEGGGSGSELPAVTAEDNGDVLTVVEGQWAKAAASGGGGIFYVHEDDNGVLDKTWNEIFTAAQTTLVVLHNAGDNPNFNVLYQIFSSSSYNVEFLGDGEIIYYETDSANGYPVYSGE